MPIRHPHALSLESLEDRVTPTTGLLDASFGNGGRFSLSSDRYPISEARGAAVQPDGKILLAGYVQDSRAFGTDSFNFFAVVRLTPDGALDPTFGDGGVAAVDFGQFVPAYSVAVRPSDGEITVAGVYPDGLIAAARFTTDGDLDPYYGVGGKITARAPVPPGFQFNVAAAGVRPTDGAVVAFGNYQDNSHISEADFAAVRITPDGQLDTSFGTGGLATLDPGPGLIGFAYSVAFQQDGKVILAGSAGSYPHSEFAAVRFDAAGGPDPTFGTVGLAAIDFGSGKDELVYSMGLRQSDGAIVLAGAGSRDDPRPAVVQLTPDGQLDPSFGTAGVTILGLGRPPDSSPPTMHSVAFRPDGRILLAGDIVGYTTDPATSAFLVTQLTTAGELDTAFGTGGTTIVHFPSLATQAALAVLPNGPLIVAGIADLNTRSIVAAKLTGDLNIIPSTLPPGTVGADYEQTLTTTGSIGPITFAVTAGALPPGLSLDPDGRLAGTPTADGSYTFTVTATSNGSDRVGVEYTVPVTRATVHLRVVGALPGEGPRVRAYSTDGMLVFDAFAFEPTFTGGVRVVTADVTGDGTDDIIAAAGAGGGPRVRVFDGKTGDTVFDVFALDDGLRTGLLLAAADVTGDGRADVLVGAGPGAGPRVVRLDGATGTTLADFFAFDPSDRGGVAVALGDVTGDGATDLIVGQLGGGSKVRVFDRTGAQLTEFDAFGEGFGVSLAVWDADRDGLADLVVGAGPGGAPRVRVFAPPGDGSVLLADQFVLDPSGRGGVRLGTRVSRDGTVRLLAAVDGETPVAIDPLSRCEPPATGDLDPVWVN